MKSISENSDSFIVSDDSDPIPVSGLYVILGHYGSGKTEFAVNLALRLAASGHRTAIADLDFVNPYFRSQERAELFAEKGITLIGSPPGCADADIPAVSPLINTLFEDESLTGVIDVGGDPAGAKALRRFAAGIRSRDPEVFFVVNAARPQSATAQAALAHMRNIGEAAGLCFTGIINNTHLCAETGMEEILTGAKLALEVSQMSGIPLICHLVPQEMEEEAKNHLSPVLPLRLYMRKPWENSWHE